MWPTTRPTPTCTAAPITPRADRRGRGISPAGHGYNGVKGSAGPFVIEKTHGAAFAPHYSGRPGGVPEKGVPKVATYQEFQQRTRRRRAKRRLRRALALLCAAFIICTAAWLTIRVMSRLSDGEANTDSLGGDASGVVAPQPTPPAGSGTPEAPQAGPVPMRASVDPGDTSWNTSGPVEQTIDRTVTSPNAAMLALPELGQVDIAYFDGVTFIGDSVTEGFDAYNTAVDGHSALLGIRSMGPDAVVNKATVRNRATNRELVVLDEVVASQPNAVYILLGTNSLVNASEAKEQSFLAYYGRMIDMLREVLDPAVRIYVQAIPPVRPDRTTKLSNEQIARVNDQLAALALQKGCAFLDLHEVFEDAEGNLKEEYAQADGIHVKPAAYDAWIDYLSRHVVYDKRNPYVSDSPYYIEQ